MMTTKVSPLLRATGVEDPGRVDGTGTGRPDPQVPERARRRTFTAQYKLDVVAEYDAAPDGEKGAVLRREGLYSSHIVEWRRARDAGALAGLKIPRGRKPRDRQTEQIARLEAEKKLLEQELAKARFVVEVQGKLQALLGRCSDIVDLLARHAGRSRRAGDRRHGADVAVVLPGTAAGLAQRARPPLGEASAVRGPPPP